MTLLTRRNLLRFGSGALAYSFARNLGGFGLANAYAQAAAPDYKALVAIFLFGGNDGNNTLVPIDNTGYSAYARARSLLALPRASLLPIQPGNIAQPYGLHPALPKMQSLFNARKAALVANVGTLLRPLTRAQAQADGAPLPFNLLSHIDQQTQWQTAQLSQPVDTGWGGLIAERLQTLSPTASYPPAVTLAGASAFCEGERIHAASVGTDGASALDGVNPSDGSPLSTALQQLLAFDSGLTLIQAASGRTSTALAEARTLGQAFVGAPALTTAFPASELGLQLQQVARIIQARGRLGLQRQVFFAALDGFDTHSRQLPDQAALLGQVDAALDAFYRATQELGVDTQVTAFTLSDFGRTLQANSSAGSDHAWGNHHLVVGGAVQGGNLYGTYPTLLPAGPDDASDEGRWIPTTALDQYGATLARWFGVGDAALPAVFPNLMAFTSRTLPFLV